MCSVVVVLNRIVFAHQHLATVSPIFNRADLVARQATGITRLERGELYVQSVGRIYFSRISMRDRCWSKEGSRYFQENELLYEFFLCPIRFRFEGRDRLLRRESFDACCGGGAPVYKYTFGISSLEEALHGPERHNPKLKI